MTALPAPGTVSMRICVALLLLCSMSPALAQAVPPAAPANDSAAKTFSQNDVLAAADDAFGKGAEGMGELVKKVFADLGEPDGYIVGREAGGAFIFGVTYGSGVLHHKIEGDMPVFWTGPSIGFDVGADGAKAFTLVYNLADTNDLFKRFAAVSGKAFLVGGVTAQYLQHDHVILVPVRLGVGWRLGINAGWMKFTRTSTLVPF